ncbi:hypothetical protein [Duganella sp. Dugasp56]|uniref:hypothetical protein n=1 Tax=Duganella sp. Dugasp56 TaxID=3243046 RepID=UPI0039AFC90D
MNMTQKAIAALCMLAVAGCAADRSSSSSDSGMSSSSYPSSSGSTSSSGSMANTTGSGATGTSGTSGSSPSMAGSGTASTGSSYGSGAQSGTSTSSSAQTSYGVVQAIDQMQRQDVGVGAVGAAAAGGSAGLPTDKVYRVTVRMDDGTSQMVVVDSMPSYKIGDRVRYNNGMLSSYQ